MNEPVAILCGGVQAWAVWRWRGGTSAIRSYNGNARARWKRETFGGYVCSVCGEPVKVVPL